MNRLYIVTGASSDVGMEYLKKLNGRLEQNDEKVTVIAHYASSDEKLKELSGLLNNIEMVIVKADLSKEAGISELLDECRKIAKDNTPYAIIHFPAPKFEYSKLKGIEWEKIEKELNVGVRSFVELCKEYVPAMAKRKEGKIVAMLTAYVDGVPPKFTAKYVMAKYALLGFVKAIASDYEGKGITVAGISPEMMETKFLSEIDSRIIEIVKENTENKELVDVAKVACRIDEIVTSTDDRFNGENIVIKD